MLTQMTPDQYAESLNRLQAVGIEWLEFFNPIGDDVRLATARELNRRAGGQRKRQGYESRRTSRRVFDELELRGETIYSRHGNHSLHPQSPMVAGPMNLDTFNRLIGNDVVVVVSTTSNIGRALLEGAVEIEDLELEIDIGDAQPTTATRIANALDVREVTAWILSQR